MIGYEELKFYWVKGLRNGNLSRLSGIQKSFYRLCLLFARKVGRIVSAFVVSQLRVIIDILVESPKSKALLKGLEKVEELKAHFKHSGVFRWAPQALQWLQDRRFIIWLGFMEINNLVYFKS